jgi:hypothetical protein
MPGKTAKGVPVIFPVVYRTRVSLHMVENLWFIPLCDHLAERSQVSRAIAPGLARRAKSCNDFSILPPAIQTKQSQHSPETRLRYSFDTTEGDAS